MLNKLRVKRYKLNAEMELKKGGLTVEDLKDIDAQVEEYRQELIDEKKDEYEEDVFELEAQIKLLDDLIKEEEKEVVEEAAAPVQTEEDPLKAEYEQYKALGGLHSFEDWKATR